MHSLARLIKFAFQDIGRNFGLSCMTVFILILMLLSVNILWSVDVLTQQAIQMVKGQVNVSVYLSPAITDKKLNEIKSYLLSFSEVTDLTVLSRDEVLASFRTRHQLSPEVLDALGELGSNPFGPTLTIKTREPSDYVKIINALEVPEYTKFVDAKSYDEHQDAITRIENITNRIERAGIGLSMVFAIISFLIIFNTIRVAIHTQHVEISIKRLVGANNWFIRGPYLIESLIFTIVSVAATCAILYFTLQWLNPYLSVVFSSGFSLFNYYQSHLVTIFGVQVLAVLVLTVVSSTLAMRRQLKV